MNDTIDKIITGDCIKLIPTLSDDSIHCLVSDIPYGISLDEWDVLHKNTNSALLGQSPAQIGKSGFKRRGKPIRGWSAADRNIPKEYQAWCAQWASSLYPKMKDGASLFIFGARRTLHRAIVALEDSGFLLKDIIKLINAMNEQGAWIEPIEVLDSKPGEVCTGKKTIRGISTLSYIKNMRVLMGYIN